MTLERVLKIIFLVKLSRRVTTVTYEINFYSKGDTLTLEKAQTLGRAKENAKKDTLLLGGEKSQSFPEKPDVNQINKYDKTPTLSNAKTKSCSS